MRSSPILLTIHPLRHVFGLILFGFTIFDAWATAQRTVGTGRSTVHAVHLTCDFRTNSIPIDDAAPELHWTLKATAPNLRGTRQTALRIIVATSRMAVAQDRGDVWDSGKVDSDSLGGKFAGKSLTSDAIYYWKVKVWDEHGTASPWSEEATFQTGLLLNSDWQARWIAASPDGARLPQARGNDESHLPMPPPLPIFRHEFSVSNSLTRATLYISGLGQAEAFINGAKVTPAVMTPGWTEYRKTVLYDACDVTALLRKGPNAIGVMLGNGMYNVPGVKGRYTKFVGSYGQPKLIAQLMLHYADGTVVAVGSGTDWKTTPGPVLFSSIYGGEDYDARKLSGNWSSPGRNDASWQQALVVEGPGGSLRAENLQPVTVSQTYFPVKITHPGQDVTLYDLGQNFAGRPSITLHGPAGTHVSILPGELLDASGRVSQESANAFPDAPVVFHYTLNGRGREHWAPQFTYYGFRYVEVTIAGDHGRPVIDSLQGESLRDDIPVNGSFSSSNPLLDQIHQLIDHAMRNNMVSILTDCPTREKLGWLEQTHLAGPSLMYNFDLPMLYRKMGLDMRDSQLKDGLVPAIAPEFVAFLDDSGKNTNFRDSPEWGSAVILSPWAAYTFYADRQLLGDNYDAMVAYANYLGSRAKNNIVSYGLGDWYDIGPGEPGESKLTGLGMTATAIYYQDLTDLARIAQILDKSSDAADFSARAAAVKASLNSHLFRADNDSYDRDSQTANAMALVLGIVPEGHRAGVLDNLVKDIRAHQNHVTAGDIGFHFVVRALTEGERSDVLYDIVTQTDGQGYGAQLKHGATALTEAWDANPKSSQDHFMLGHAEEWFYRGLGGIDFDMNRDKDKRIWIHPQIVAPLASVTVTFDSILGPIASHWKVQGSQLVVEISIPAGQTATISLPPEFRLDPTESGRPLKDSLGILSVIKNGPVTCILGSGSYHFEVPR